MHAPAHDLEVGRIKMLLPERGGHHVILYRHTGSDDPVWPPHECDTAVSFKGWQAVAQIQRPPAFDWQLPPGVAINFGPREPLLMQTHFVRSGVAKRKKASLTKTMLYPVDPATVTAHAGTLFAHDQTVLIPPGEHTLVNRCAFTGEGSAARELKMIGITGHYHVHGTRFEAYRVLADGSLGERLYEWTGFDAPDPRQYDNLVFHPGEGIEWRCTYQNTGTEPIVFGTDAARQEHCSLFGLYYPTDTPREAMDCQHTRDANGQDVFTRTLIP